MEWNLEEALEYYRRQGAPGDQNALIALLKEIQKENGSIPAETPAKIAEFYGIREPLVLALIRRIPRVRLSGGLRQSRVSGGLRRKTRAQGCDRETGGLYAPVWKRPQSPLGRRGVPPGGQGPDSASDGTKIRLLCPC